MRRAILVFILLGVLDTVPVLSQEAISLEPIGASIREEPDMRIFEAILPGDLVDWMPHPSTGSLAFLIELEDESRQVMLWSLDSGDLAEIGGPLPAAVESVVGLQGTDSPAVVIASGGTLLGARTTSDWRELIELPLDLYAIRTTRGGRHSSQDNWVLRSVGRLQSLAPDPVTAEWRVEWQLDLPLRVDREWGGLRLASPPVMSMPGTPAKTSSLILGPEAHGKRRLRSLLITPTAEGDVETAEMWSLLPSAEDLEESWYVDYEGQPALIVTTVLAEKHGVFEKKKMRLFTLAADRTRSGTGPVLEVMTRSRNWYRTCAGIADVNGDGLDDLISAQPKGLGAGSLWVEAHLALPTGGFNPKVRGSEIEVEEGELCTLATDIDGDDRVDLVVVEDDALLVFPLVDAAASKVVVDETPRWRVAFAAITGRPRPVELLSSSPSQMLVVGRTEGKRQAVRIVQFH